MICVHAKDMSGKTPSSCKQVEYGLYKKGNSRKCFITPCHQQNTTHTHIVSNNTIYKPGNESLEGWTKITINDPLFLDTIVQDRQVQKSPPQEEVEHLTTVIRQLSDLYTNEDTIRHEQQMQFLDSKKNPH